MTLASLVWRRYHLTFNIHAMTCLLGAIVTHEPKHVDESWDAYTSRWRLSFYLGPVRLGLAVYR